MSSSCSFLSCFASSMRSCCSSRFSFCSSAFFCASSCSLSICSFPSWMSSPMISLLEASKISSAALPAFNISCDFSWSVFAFAIVSVSSISLSFALEAVTFIEPAIWFNRSAFSWYSVRGRFCNSFNLSTSSFVKLSSCEPFL